MRQFNIPLIYGAVVATVLLGLSSCNADPEGNLKAPRSAAYFSLADYFEKEAVRLNKQNPTIVKTVAKNGVEEQQEINIAYWKKEFALFIDADINKPAWQNSYRVDSTAFSVTYTATDSTLRTKEIRVDKSDTGTVTHIHVSNQVNNMLYTTDEQLDYYVDSLYRIIKDQRVRIIGKSHYTVTGEWL